MPAVDKDGGGDRDEAEGAGILHEEVARKTEIF